MKRRRIYSGGMYILRLEMQQTSFGSQAPLWYAE